MYTHPRHNRRNHNPANIIETDTGYQIDLIIPGYDREEISVEVEKGELIVTADHKADEAKVTYREWAKQPVHRRWTLGDAIDISTVSAQLKAGILHITMAKVPEMAPKKIEIA